MTKPKLSPEQLQQLFAEVKARCVNPPVGAELKIVGSYSEFSGKSPRQRQYGDVDIWWVFPPKVYTAEEMVELRILADSSWDGETFDDYMDPAGNEWWSSYIRVVDIKAGTIINGVGYIFSFDLETAKEAEEKLRELIGG